MRPRSMLAASLCLLVAPAGSPEQLCQSLAELRRLLVVRGARADGAEGFHD